MSEKAKIQTNTLHICNFGWQSSFLIRLDQHCTMHLGAHHHGIWLTIAFTNMSRRPTPDPPVWKWRGEGAEQGRGRKRRSRGLRRGKVGWRWGCQRDPPCSDPRASSWWKRPLVGRAKCSSRRNAATRESCWSTCPRQDFWSQKIQHFFMGEFTAGVRQLLLLLGTAVIIQGRSTTSFPNKI